MGKVIEGKFGEEKERHEVLSATEMSLLLIGSIYGDDPNLMRAKAKVLVQLYDEAIASVQPAHIHLTLPKDISEEDQEALIKSIALGVQETVQATIRGALGVFTAHMIDLCTSRLRK